MLLERFRVAGTSSVHLRKVQSKPYVATWVFFSLSISNWRPMPPYTYTIMAASTMPSCTCDQSSLKHVQHQSEDVFFDCA